MTTITDPAATVKSGDSPIARTLRQLGTDTAYVFVGFPLGIAAFVIIITGLALGGGLLVTLLGIPVLVATLFAARGLAQVERLRMAPVLRRPRVPVPYKQIPPGAGVWRKLLTPLSDVQAWLDVLHAIVRFPISVFGFCVVLTWWAVALTGLTYGLWGWTLPRDRGTDAQVGVVLDNRELPELLGFEDTPLVRITFYLIIGVLFTAVLPYVVRACALLEAWVGRALLTGVAQLRVEISGLTERAETAQAQTAAAVSAEATALRRLERDIHDGPQQRLVRLTMDLGRARSQLDSDPEAAGRIVDEAVVMARETLDELRNLSRGIAPPILADRGLAAAVAALAARSTVPVDVDVPDIARLDPAVEQTAYFAIAESLTNLAKHSRADECVITIRHASDRLEVIIRDNGVGGAHLAKGHGLAGLADRLQAVGGQLRVSSPPGGPTEIRADLPWRQTS
jgi:signal transduction histidine kinase